MDLVYSHFQSKPFAVPDFHTGDLTWKTIMSEWSNPSMSFEKKLGVYVGKTENHRGTTRLFTNTFSILSQDNCWKNHWISGVIRRIMLDGRRCWRARMAEAEAPSPFILEIQKPGRGSAGGILGCSRLLGTGGSRRYRASIANLSATSAMSKTLSFRSWICTDGRLKLMPPPWRSWNRLFSGRGRQNTRANDLYKEQHWEKDQEDRNLI